MAKKWSRQTYNEIINTVKKVIEEEIIQYIYETMHSVIYSTVYGAYDATTADLRRYDANGGLGDMSVYSYEIEPTGDGFRLKIYNNSKARGDNEPDYLDQYVVEGKYTWKDSRIYKQGLKRDFYTDTLEELMYTGKLLAVMKKRFWQYGINVK